MRVGNFEEKRKTKRIDLSLPVTLKQVLEEGKEEQQTGLTINVSYNGVYVVDINIKDIQLDDKLHISLSVPRDSTRDFPFSRITGKARVARVEKDGVALEFNEDVSRLFIAN